jgi:iron complex outermembrane receptor protein
MSYVSRAAWSTKSRLRRGTALATGAAVLAAALAGAASAQDVVQTTDQSNNQTTAQSSQPSEQAIVVTGSRLKTQFTSDAPVDIIAADVAQDQGIPDVAALLRAQTVAAGSPQVTAATSSAFVQSGGIGVETLSLRGLGADRTLTLLNGRRAGPAGTRGEVSAFDLNVIPLSAVDRIEILKDGASSIYGSDAVAGVVNIITKRGGGGGEINAFYSQPQQPGGEQTQIDGSWGTDFDHDRGWIRLTGSYNKQFQLKRGDRSYFSCGEDYVFDPITGARRDILDPRTGKPHCADLPWGQIWTYDYTNPAGSFAVTPPWQARPAFLQYDYDGNLGKYIPAFGPGFPVGGGLTTPPGWFGVGYGELARPTATFDPIYSQYALASDGVMNENSPLVEKQSLQPQVEKETGFLNGEFKLTDHMTLYGEALFNRRQTIVNAYRQFWTYQYVYNTGDGFAGDPVAIAQGFTGDFLGFSPTAVTDHAATRVTVDYQRFVTGLKGDFGDLASSWTWDVYAQYSKSEGEYNEDIIFNDAIAPYQFRNSSCAGTVTPVRGVPCVDINWYSPQLLAGNLTAEEQAFLFGDAVGNTIYSQWNVDGYASGDLFSVPAGKISGAFGFQYRQDHIDDEPSPIILAGNAWGQSVAGPTRGSQTTEAVYGEIGVPILADMFLAKRLDVTASARYTDISSQGPIQESADPTDLVNAKGHDESVTYKVGTGWQIAPAFKIRATYGTSFRSPALYELFLGDETSFLDQRTIDPCVNWGAQLAANAITQRVADNCAADGVPANHNGTGATATIFSKGGVESGLKSETSDATSVGIVLTPHFADLSVSIDYFAINIDNEVTQLGASNILAGCYNSLHFSTEPLCKLFTRAPSGSGAAFNVVTVQDDFVNIAHQTNRGIDLELLYNTDTPLGKLSIGSHHTYQIENVNQLLPETVPLNTTGMAGYPKWVGDLSFTLDHGPWSFFYGVRYVGGTSNVDHFGDQPQTYYGTPAVYKLTTEPVVYHDLSVSRKLPKGFEVRLGVANLFDEAPPAVTGLSGEYDRIGNSAFYSQYDWVGRRFFINLGSKF